jgi:asparagine synthase (glutamine-hydrolysing)
LAALVDQPPAQRYLTVRQKWTPSERAAVYTHDFRRRLDAGAADATYLKAPIEWKRSGSVEAAVALDTIHGLPEDLLMKSDKMGSAHGVECRSPFLEAEFAAWAQRLPVRFLLQRGRGKILLRKAAEAILPKDLIYRRKQGFQTPVARWLKGPLRVLLEPAFEPVFLRHQGIFDPAALALLKRRFEDPEPSPALAGQVWQIVCLQTWWRQIY